MATPAEGDGRGTRERLTRTALRLFAERGYDGVSNREIVEACGLTKGAIYWYFESKEHLFRSIVAENLAAFQERVVGAAQVGGTWHEQLAAVFGVFTAVLDDRDDPHRDLLILLVHRLPGGPGQSDIGQVFQERFASWVESVVGRGDVEPAPHALADLVVSTGLGVLTQASMGRNVARDVLGALLTLLGAVDAAPVTAPRAAGRRAF